MIAASLLLLLEEEDAFWIMVTIVEDILPASYYSSTLLGIVFHNTICIHTILKRLLRRRCVKAS